MGYLVARLRYSTKWCYRYEISMRESYREDGKVKKKETYLMTYYLPWITKNSPHPQIDREYPEQYENISPNHVNYFEEDKTLMSKVVEKVKQSEIKRFEARKRRDELFEFGCNWIRRVTDIICKDVSLQTDFFYFVNRQGMDRYIGRVENYFDKNEDVLTEEIKLLYERFCKMEK